MEEELKQQLLAVEETAQKIAKGEFNRRVFVTSGALLAILICLTVLGSTAGLLVELVILFAVVRFTAVSKRNFQKPLYEGCDPYLQYAIVKLYGNNRMPKFKSAKIQNVIALAQCMILAGEPQESLNLLKEIRQPELLPIGNRVVYYNTLFNIYGQFCWEQKRAALRSELTESLGKISKKEAGELAVILRMEELVRRQNQGNSAFVLEYFEKSPPKFMFQKVGMHYSLAVAYLASGKQEAAAEHADYVIAHGNKLYYKKDIEKRMKQAATGVKEVGKKQVTLGFSK